MSDVALHVEHVSKSFRRGEIYDSLRDLIPALTGRMFRARADGELDERDFWALNDVSFEVKQGEAFGIIGHNGAGKSTMLKLLTGIMLPTRGRITVRGRLSALIEVSAGFHQDLTGRENIFLNGAILGLKRDEIRRRFDEIVAFSGLEAFIDTPVKRYSSGMFARLGFSVAAHVDPEVLLVDEVLSVGDYSFQRKCIERMDQVIRNGTTVVFISHNLRAVANLCQRSLLLRAGRVTMIDETSAVLKKYLEGEDRRSENGDRGIEITKVDVGNAQGPTVEFQSGDKVLVTVEAVARRRHEDVSVVIQVTDDQAYPLFDSCTDRLGQAPFIMEPGQRVRVTFEIEALLAEGTFHVNGYLFAYTTNRAYDKWANAATFFVGGAPAVRGSVNLQPRLVSFDLTGKDREAPRLANIAVAAPGFGDADDDPIAP